MKVIQNLKNQTKSHYILHIVLILSFFISFSHDSVSAESFNANVTIKPSLTLNIPTSSIVMNLDPANHDFEEQDLTISVGTNNPNGFKLYVTTPSNNTDLVNTADSTKNIPNLTSSYATSSFPANNWGYRITEDASSSSGDYGIFTPSSSTPIIESNGPVNKKMATLGFASKIDYLKPSGTYELDLSFKALPIVTQYTMQELGTNSTLAAQVCTEDPTVVIDSRDEQLYIIQRLKDGNCWMMGNLNLGATTLSTDLTSSNTNLSTTITAATFNDWKKTSGSATYTAAEFIPVSGTDPTSNTAYGTLYNYCAASANTVCPASNSSDASSDLCPAGWRLPTGGNNGEFQTLYNNSSYNTYEKMRASVFDNGASFTLAGVFYDSAPTGQNSYGGYWSSTRYNNSSMYRLYLTPPNNINPVTNGYRDHGYIIRCLLK